MKIIYNFLFVVLVSLLCSNFAYSQSKKPKEYVALWGSIGTNFSDGISTSATLRFSYVGVSIGRSGNTDKLPLNFILNTNPLDFDPPDTSFTLETFRRPTTTIDVSGFYPVNSEIFLQGSLGVGFGSDAVLANNEGQYYAWGTTNSRTIIAVQLGMYYDFQPIITGVSWHTNRGVQLSAGISF